MPAGFLQMLRYARPAARRPGRSLSAARVRFAALVAAILLVFAARAELRRPATHDRLGVLFGSPAAPLASPSEPPPVVEGVAFDDVVDNTFFRDEEQAAWFGVLSELKQADDASLSANASPVAYAELASQPEAYRGRAVRVAGTVRRIESVAPAENDAGVETLHRVTLQPTGGGVWPITVYTLAAPPEDLLENRATAAGYFFKNQSYRWADGVGVTPIVLAKRLALSAAESPQETGVATATLSERDLEFEPTDGEPVGRTLLAHLGVSADRLASVVDRQPLSAAESDAFYAVLNATAQTPATQLARLARADLKRYARRHAESATSRRERMVADEVGRRAAEGRYSVAPLFGDGAAQRGELIVVDAIVRRVVRVDADEAARGRYFELQAFSDDSQNLPLVFVVRDLPKGFPIGEAVRQPARLAGFFFKQWAYRTRKPTEGGGDRRQFAPLLIGRAPIALAAPAAPWEPGVAVGVVGALAVAAVALVLWRAGVAQRRYEATTLRRVRESDERDFSALQDGAPEGSDER